MRGRRRPLTTSVEKLRRIDVQARSLHAQGGKAHDRNETVTNYVFARRAVSSRSLGAANVCGYGSRDGHHRRSAKGRRGESHQHQDGGRTKNEEQRKRSIFMQ